MPCFDQPDLKATMGLSIITHQTWKAFSNSAPDENRSEPVVTAEQLAEEDLDWVNAFFTKGDQFSGL